ncbi:hypothetical protein B0H15DRAFT_943595 [Mycena belliarum]|uniref:Uncharacterized protein n=1 Tax=Mycena belliarum TaxID=1033014 RepID=A0AAD6UG21_9AGAR|nr:hypothetical protein B0H15DRAFT_943595 [Mycena belliae]
MNLDGAEIKLVRIIKELEFLSGVDASEAARQAATPRQMEAAKKKSVAAIAKTTQSTSRDDESEARDPSYRPKRPSTLLSEEEDDDFEDVTGDEASPPATGPKKRKVIVVDGVAAAPPPKKVDVIEIEDDSADECGPRDGGRRGPKSDTRQHFRPPTATSINGEKRWAFQCHHCKSCLSVERTVDKTKSFEDERPGPRLGNLATHYNKHHKDVPAPARPFSGQSHTISASSAKIMGDFLRDGKLNPVINSTQGNFLKIFAAWIIEDDLAFTTGETQGIKRLFAFLQTRYLLPSDTTDIESKIAIQTDTWTTRAMTFTFAGSIASFIMSDWELVERVIDFHLIEDKEHEGKYAALGLAKQLANFQVLEKISRCHLWFSLSDSSLTS